MTEYKIGSFFADTTGIYRLDSFDPDGMARLSEVIYEDGDEVKYIRDARWLTPSELRRMEYMQD